jgi:hypothetical protein
MTRRESRENFWPGALGGQRSCASWWSRLRTWRERRVVCSVACVMEWLTKRWAENEQRTFVLTCAEYARVREETRRAFGARGVRYVGPWCSWHALRRFLSRAQAQGSGIVCAVPGKEEKVMVQVLGIDRAGVTLELTSTTPETDVWPPADAKERWSCVVAVPSVRMDRASDSCA